jgi:hypothetical protein
MLRKGGSFKFFEGANDYKVSIMLVLYLNFLIFFPFEETGDDAILATASKEP